MTATIGFVGFGEVGHALAMGYRAAEQGLAMVAYDAAAQDRERSALVTGRAAEAGVNLRSDPAAVTAEAEVVFCAVPAAAALEVAGTVVPTLRPGQGYYDLTASHPGVKRRIGELVAGHGDVAFADCAIVGPVRVLGHRVPIIASGRMVAAHRDLFTRLGMRVDLVSGEPGDASATKLCRSVFTKGIEALLVETMLVATRQGVADRVLDSLADTLSAQPFLEAANRYITGNAVHAPRRVHELEDVVALLRSSGVRPLVTAGSLARMRAAADAGGREHFHDVAPESYQDVIAFYETQEVS